MSQMILLAVYTFKFLQAIFLHIIRVFLLCIGHMCIGLCRLSCGVHKFGIWSTSEELGCTVRLSLDNEPILTALVKIIYSSAANANSLLPIIPELMSFPCGLARHLVVWKIFLFNIFLPTAGCSHQQTSLLSRFP